MSSRDPPHHHPVPKLQERTQEEIMMGNKNLPVPGTPGTTIPFQNLQEGRQEEIMMGDKNPAPPSHSKPPRRETRGDYLGRQE